MLKLIWTLPDSQCFVKRLWRFKDQMAHRMRDRHRFAAVTLRAKACNTRHCDSYRTSWHRPEQSDRPASLNYIRRSCRQGNSSSPRYPTADSNYCSTNCCPPSI